MRRIRERVGAGEVRHRNVNPCSAARDPVNFLHYLNDVLQVLDNVINVDRLEAGVRKRPRCLVQIVNYVGFCLHGAVDVDSIFAFSIRFRPQPKFSTAGLSAYAFERDPSPLSAGGI